MSEEFFQFEYGQIKHITHALRLAILTIFIVDISKWHKRIHIPLIFGIWISNEFVCMILFEKLTDDSNTTLRYSIVMASGLLFILMALIYYKWFSIDPIDHSLIINEQALNLTSSYTNRV
jgi:hypothetical protein